MDIPRRLRIKIYNIIFIFFISILFISILYIALEIFFTLNGNYGIEKFIIGESLWNNDVKNGQHLSCVLSSNPGLGWELRPQEMINGYVRFEKKPRRKPPGVFRIVVIGDSIAQQGYFEKYLEDKLNSSGINKQFEVWNCGVSGYNITNYYYYLREKALRFDPDLIILALCLNDFSATNLIVYDGKKFMEFFNPFIVIKIPFSRYLFLHSRVYRFIVFGLEKYILKKISIEKILIDKLDRMIRIASRKRIGMVALIWPYLKDRYTRDEQYEYDRMRYILEAKGIPYLDLHKTFDNRDNPDLRLNLRDYIHPSESAFKIMTEDIYDFICNYLEEHFDYRFKNNVS